MDRVNWQENYVYDGVACGAIEHLKRRMWLLVVAMLETGALGTDLSCLLGLVPFPLAIYYELFG